MRDREDFDDVACEHAEQEKKREAAKLCTSNGPHARDHGEGERAG